MTHKVTREPVTKKDPVVDNPDIEDYLLFEEDEIAIPVRQSRQSQPQVKNAPVYTGIPDPRMNIVREILYRNIDPKRLDEEDERQLAINIADVLFKYFLMFAVAIILGVINLAALIVILIAIF